MKIKMMLTGVIAVFIAISFTSIAQQKKPVAKAENKPLEQVMAFSGQVGSWAYNEDYVYNGFYLQTTSDKYLVKFPTHMGNELTTALKTGSTITVNGVECASPQGGKEIKMVSIIDDGKEISNSPLVKTDVKPVIEIIKGSGNIIELQKDKKSKIIGFILDNKTILRVSQHVAIQLNKLAVVGTSISYSGDKKHLRNGEVAANDYILLLCQSITINGKQYLTKK